MGSSSERRSERKRGGLDLRPIGSPVGLVVLLGAVIVAALAVVLIVRLSSGHGPHDTLAACRADRRAISTALESFYSRYGTYPGTLHQLVPHFLHQLPSSTAYQFHLAPVTGQLTSTLTGC